MCIDVYEYIYIYMHIYGFPGCSAGKESTCNSRDPSLILGLGRSPGEGIGYPLQYSWASLVPQTVKNPPAMQEIWVWFKAGRLQSLLLGNTSPSVQGRVPTVRRVGKEQTMTPCFASELIRCPVGFIFESHRGHSCIWPPLMGHFSWPLAVLMTLAYVSREWESVLGLRICLDLGLSYFGWC